MANEQPTPEQIAELEKERAAHGAPVHKGRVEVKEATEEQLATARAALRRMKTG